MQLKRLLIAAMLTLPANAALTCDVALNTPGILKLSSDGATLSSANGGGVPMVVVISSLNFLSPTTITLSNIRLDATPAGFAAPVSYSGSYSASWLLTGTSGTIAPQASFNVPAVLNLAVTLTLNNTVTSTGGFKQGPYSTKTTITCS
jgi:hypothetical protein